MRATRCIAWRRSSGPCIELLAVPVGAPRVVSWRSVLSRADQAGSRTMTRRTLRLATIAIAALLTAALAPGSASAQGGAPDFAAIIAAPDRSDADRETDKRRDPVKLLAFT